MTKCLADTNVLIRILKGNSELSDWVDSLDCVVYTTVYVELIQGAKDKKDVEKIEIALTAYELIHFDQDISRRTISLIQKYSKSHGLLLADAMIAAVCLEKRLNLVTFNAKDFRFIDGLKLIVPKK